MSDQPHEPSALELHFDQPPIAIRVRQNSEIIIEILPDGSILWRGNEVETSADFRGMIVEFLRSIQEVGRQ